MDSKASIENLLLNLTANAELKKQEELAETEPEDEKKEEEVKDVNHLEELSRLLLHDKSN